MSNCLSEDVELQLQSVLDNRPNKEFKESRSTRKMKDIKKQALRGNSYIMDSILESKVNKVAENNPLDFNVDREIIEFRSFGMDEYTSYYMDFLSKEEIRNCYPGFIVEQVKDNNSMVQVKHKRAGWVIKTYGMTLSSRNSWKHLPTLSMQDNFTGSIKEFKKFLSSRHDADSAEDVIRYINYRIKEAYDNEIKLAAYNSLNNHERDIVRTTLEGYKESNWSSKVHVSRKRSSLKNYINKELLNDGDFQLLHNKVDLFEDVEYVY